MGRFSGYLLASDVDGTLLGRDNKISSRASDAISYFIGEGGLFTVATGRTPLTYEIVRPRVQINAPAVLGNGAIIYDYQNGRELHRQCLDGEYVEMAREAARLFPEVSIEIHSDDCLWVYNHGEYTKKHFELIGRNGRVIDDFDIPPKPWIKAVFVQRPELLEPVRRFVESYGDAFMLVSSTEFFQELMHPDANKGAGVARLGKLMGISPERTYVVGDSDNDLPMITRFHSFAPANSDEAVKKAAREQVCSVYDGAVADVIERLSKETVV